MSEVAARRDPVEQMAEEFMARLRRGERPALSEYTTAHPELAEEIRDLFPALVMMEEIKPAGTEPPPTEVGPGVLPEYLGDYRILREVARGGMGVVYEAEQVALGRHVALKVLPTQHVGDALRLLRFRREARSAARLHHTNIVPVFDVGVADGVHYYAMQFIRGQGIDEVLQELRRLRSGEKPTDAPAADLTASLADGLRTGVFPAAPIVPVPRPAVPDPRSEASAILTGTAGHYLRSVARLGVQAAEALAYAHGQRVLHRDVKPSNLLLDREGVLWLTDFGLAKDDGDDLTRTGDIVGTIRYMAPERFRGVSDPRTDVYALGVTLYEMLTLRPAFPEQDRVLLIKQIAADDPPRPRAIDPTLPRDLETVVLKAIEKEPGRRYPTAAEMAEDLRLFLADRPIKARRASWREQAWRWCRRNPGVAASLSVAFALLVLGIAVSTGQAVRATRAEGLAEHRLEKEVEANQVARRRLFEARRAEATASRYSRRAGQRFNGLRALTEAVALARELDLGEETLARLRDDAIACLALADVQPVKDWEGVPAGSSSGLAFDADLRHYARSDQTGEISVRRVSDDQRVAVLIGDGKWPNSGAAEIRFSPDGTRLAVAYWSLLPEGKTKFRLWDWQRGEVVFEAMVLLNQGTFDFSSDGRGIVVSQTNGVLSLLDAGTGRAAWRVNTGSPILGAAYHPDGSQIAVGSQHKRQIQIRRSDTGELLRTLSTPNGCESLPVWHPDGIHLATAGVDYCVYLYDTTRSGEPSVLRSHQNSGVMTRFDPGSGLVMSSSWDGVQRLCDPWTRRELLRFEGDRGWFDRDGRQFASLEGKRLKLWEMAAGREYRTLPTYRKDPEGGELLHPVNRGGGISRDGRWLALGTREGLRLWDVALEKEVVVPVTSTMLDAKFHPSGNELYTCGPDGVYAWAIRSEGESLRIGPARSLDARTVGAEELSLDREGRLLTVVGRSTVRVLDLKNPSRAIPPLNHVNCIAVSISPNGRWVASGTNNGHGVQVREIATGEVHELVPKERSTRVSFSPDDRWLAVGTGDGCGIWRVGTWDGAVLHIPREQGSGVALDVAFSPDGRVLAVPLSQSAVRLFDTTTWLPLARLQSPEADTVGLVGFTPDGGRLVVSTKEGPVHLWDLRLIRGQLREMELDWDQPSYPPTPTAKPRPVRAELLPGAYSPLAKEHFSAGQVQAKAGRWREAVVSFSQAIEVDPNYHDAYLSRGVAHRQLKEWDKQIADTTEAIRLRPEVASTWNNRGGAFAALGQWDKAIEDYSEAIKWNPKDTIVRENRGVAHAEKGQWDKAEGDFVKAAELAPERGRIHYHLALLKLAQRDMPGYRKACAGMLARPVKDLSPADALSVAWVCVITPDTGVDPAEVIRLAERAIEGDRKNPDALQKWGAALYRAGRHEAAVKVLTETEAVAVGTPYRATVAEYTWLFLALSQHRLGREPEARKWLDRAVRAGEHAGAPWNRRLAFGLLRREAEELLKAGPAENKSKQP